LFEQLNFRFSNETLLGIICKDRTFLLQKFVRELGAFYKIEDDYIHRLWYLSF
jgi:hypothetical protein